MNYVYRDSGTPLPDGIEGNYVAVQEYPYSGDYYGDATVLRETQEPLDISRMKVLDGVLTQMNEAEREIMDALEAEQAASAEIARQAAKPEKLKAAENNFFALCSLLGLSGKPGFGEIQAVLDGMEDQDQAAALAIRLLGIDAECKREGGLQWWDGAIYHSEVSP